MPDATPPQNPKSASPAPPAAAPAPRRLGRGLSSLISTSPPVPISPPAVATQVPPPPTSRSAGGTTVGMSKVEVVPSAPSGKTVTPPASPTAEGLVWLPIESIQTNPRQPRELFDQGAIQRLSESIRSSGLMQPIVVRPSAKGHELVAGERRLRASKLAGLKTIPAIVRTLGDRESAEWALVENLQREDLNPIERARGVSRLVKEFQLTHQAVAESLGLERATVSNLLRLLDLDDFTASMVASGRLDQGHAKVLLGVADPTVRRTLAASSVDRQWSVRRLEMEVRRLIAPETPVQSPSIDRGRASGRVQVEDLQRRLSEHLGTRVEIVLGRRKGEGRVMIDFHSLAEFDGLMERIGFVAD